MSSANPVPETWNLSGDDAWETLKHEGRLQLATDAFRRFRSSDGTSHARSLALLAVLIVIEGIVALVGLASAAGAGRLSTTIVQALQTIMPGPAGKVLTEAVHQAHQASSSHHSSALILGAVGVIATSTVSMGQLERGLNRIYGIERDRPTSQKYSRGLILTITAGTLIVGAFIALTFGRSLTASIGGGVGFSVWNAVRWPLGTALAMAAIALLFRWSPRRRQPAWSWLAFGSAIAVVLWTLATVGLSLWLLVSPSFGQTYGPLAGVIVLCLWAFFSSVAMLYGAAVAAQLEAIRAGALSPKAQPDAASHTDLPQHAQRAPSRA